MRCLLAALLAAPSTLAASSAGLGAALPAAPPPLAASSAGLGAPLPAETSDYVVILDAGSTGTRAQAFYYPKRLLRPITRDFVVSRPFSLPKPLFFIDARPGISNFKGDDAGLYHYLRDFTSKVAKRLQEHDKVKRLSEVPIYLGATAGMRNLGLAARRRLFKPIREALQDSPFFFGHASHARVLSGEEEAAYGWLTVNYYHSSIRAENDNTLGSLDMGGESVEVAFIPEEPSIMAGLFPMHFGELPGTIHLYTHSYMHFGIVAAFQSASQQLLHGASAERVEHPCLPRGLHWNVQERLFGVSTSGHAERSHGPLALVGTSDFERCEEVAGEIIQEAPCSQPPCSFLGVYQPSLENVRFYLTGEFSKIIELLVPKHSEAPLLQALRKAAKHFCGRPLKEQEQAMSRRPSAQPSDPALACFVACYSYAFLVKGLGFEANTTSLIAEHSKKHDWPQGAAIYHVNFYPYRVIVAAEEQASEIRRTMANATKPLEQLKTPANIAGVAGGQRAGNLSSGGPLEPRNASSNRSSREVIPRDAKHLKSRKALHRYLREQKRHLLRDEAKEVEMLYRLKRVIARVRKRKQAVERVKELLGRKHSRKHGAKHARHSGRSERRRSKHKGKAKDANATASGPPLRRAFEVDAAAIALAALASGACLAVMACTSSLACCKRQSWRRSAQERLLDV